MSKSRKQKQKTQDFQKKKLKVGKPKAKASNVTDTSFVSRTISVRNQHLGEHDEDFSKRLSLLKHHNSTVRKETLQTFQKMIQTIIHTRMMTPLLTQCIPLMCDESRQVRSALMDLFDEVGQYNDQVLKLLCKMLVLYVNMAMTHITSAIQYDSAKFLSCLLRYCGDEICRQAFAKLLMGLFSLLGWSKNKSQNARKLNANQAVAHMDTLYELIRHGCQESLQADADTELQASTNQYLIPEYPQPYEYLKLFTRQLQTRDSPFAVVDLSTQDAGARQRVLKEQDLTNIHRQLDIYIKEGGNAGKSANSLKKLLEELQ
ncbi:rRNA processing protein [Zygosaccharomyces mellis]|uniref:Pre-rRNA-processing protein n=1 Tax=Zygosaccharomyces mellis TaxID=42258 RepID=A0A4C2E246_9SACH|nr:rRNA processing protein [Zygosaccharomyces mellis]